MLKKSSSKTLPPIDNKDIHLSDYDYTLEKNQKDRKKTLDQASKKEGTLKILRRLNLIRNYTSVEKNKNKMTKDIEYLKEKYIKEKLHN